jgi:hypothetical protein
VRLCPTGKFAYAEEGYARKKLAYLACLPDEQRKVRAPTRTYRCPKCGWWHLTSQVHR